MAQGPENRLYIVMYALQEGYVTGPNAVRVEDVYPPIYNTVITALGSLGTAINQEDVPDGGERFDFVPSSLDEDDRAKIIPAIIAVHAAITDGTPGQVQVFKNHRNYETGIAER